MLKELIAEFCPNGVELKKLSEIIISLRTGLNPRKFFKLNTPDARNFYITIRELHNGKILPDDKTNLINDEALILCNNRSKLEIGDVLFSGTGTIGELAVIEKIPTNWNIKEGVYSITPVAEIVNSKFLMYALQTNEIRQKIFSKIEGGTVKSISMDKLKEIKIPIPPLPVQAEIVKILDKFTNFTTELISLLTEELKLRKKQYEYYRDKLLTFDNVEFKKLGEILKICHGKDYKKFGVGNVPVYGSGGIMTYIDTAIYNTPSVLIPRKGSVDKLYYVDIPFWTVDTIFFTKIDTTLANPKFIYFSLKKQHLEKLNHAGGVPSLTKSVLDEVKIPVPPLEEQERIVAILDKFDKLCNDLCEGIPAEIAARKKQYEYYRDLLLTFEEKN